MSKLKLVWRVQSGPTGPYRSFQHRGWPQASYGDKDGKLAVMLYCEKSYCPKDVKSGDHPDLKILLCHHNHPNCHSWEVLTLRRRAKTLTEAKQLAQDFLERHPEFWPKEYQS